MIDHRSPTATLVARLAALADTPFRLGAFLDLWREFGWDARPGASASERFGLRVDVPGGWQLLVDPLRAAVLGASLPFCYWDGYQREGHPDPKDWQRERARFDRAFEGAAELAMTVLRRAPVEWADQDPDRHRAAFWCGAHGVLILQQACADPQFGVEVDFWLHPGPLERLEPSSPLIDRLTGASQDAHSRDGFPPLEWG
jgi:hypothetical protein